MKHRRVRMMGCQPGRFGLVAALAAVLTSGGCLSGGESSYDYATVCTDRYGNRVEDAHCAHSPTSYPHDSWVAGAPQYEWYYLPTGGSYPPIGQRVHGGTWNTTRLTGPSGGTPQIQRGGGAPKAGGSIQRGGFGSAGSKSGGG